MRPIGERRPTGIDAKLHTCVPRSCASLCNPGHCHAPPPSSKRRRAGSHRRSFTPLGSERTLPDPLTSHRDDQQRPASPEAAGSPRAIEAARGHQPCPRTHRRDGLGGRSNRRLDGDRPGALRAGRPAEGNGGNASRSGRGPRGTAALPAGRADQQRTRGRGARRRTPCPGPPRRGRTTGDRCITRAGPHPAGVRPAAPRPAGRSTGCAGGGGTAAAERPACTAPAHRQSSDDPAPARREQRSGTRTATCSPRRRPSGATGHRRRRGVEPGVRLRDGRRPGARSTPTTRPRPATWPRAGHGEQWR